MNNDDTFNRNLDLIDDFVRVTSDNDDAHQTKQSELERLRIELKRQEEENHDLREHVVELEIKVEELQANHDETIEKNLDLIDEMVAVESSMHYSPATSPQKGGGADAAGNNNNENDRATQTEESETTRGNDDESVKLVESRKKQDETEKELQKLRQQEKDMESLRNELQAARERADRERQEREKVAEQNLRLQHELEKIRQEHHEVFDKNLELIDEMVAIQSSMTYSAVPSPNKAQQEQLKNSNSEKYRNHENDDDGKFSPRE